MAIVVTGATGQLGALVVQHLLARGVKARHIVAAGRNPDRLAAVAEHGVHRAAIDFDDPDSLEKAFGRGDTVLFVSGSEPGARMAQHERVVRAAERARVGRLVYTSISRADSLDTVLTPDHRATEALIAGSGIPSTILRNNLYMELEVQHVLEAAQRNEFVTGWENGQIAGAARSDYAEGAAAVLVDAPDAQVLELTGDHAWGGLEVAAAAEELLGHPVTYTSRTSDETDVQLGLMGVLKPERDFRIALDRDVREQAFAQVVPTLSGLLGRPTTRLVDALRAALPDELPEVPSTAATGAHGAAG